MSYRCLTWRKPQRKLILAPGVNFHCVPYSPLFHGWPMKSNAGSQWRFSRRWSAEVGRLKTWGSGRIDQHRTSHTIASLSKTEAFPLSIHTMMLTFLRILFPFKANLLYGEWCLLPWDELMETMWIQSDLSLYHLLHSLTYLCLHPPFHTQPLTESWGRVWLRNKTIPQTKALSIQPCCPFKS